VREIQEVIKHGVRKINVDTDLRLAATGAIRKAFAEDSSEFDPRYYLKPARAAMQGVVKARMEAFGQAGHTKDYDLIPLADMAIRYREQGHALKVT
jgi:fructose-bisphosphate aldolase class II